VIAGRSWFQDPNLAGRRRVKLSHGFMQDRRDGGGVDQVSQFLAACQTFAFLGRLDASKRRRDQRVGDGISNDHVPVVIKRSLLFETEYWWFGAGHEVLPC
jgi:hypothetical protein